MCNCRGTCNCSIPIGPQGPAGAAGATGSAGAAGAAGANGIDGTDGIDGTNGVAVVNDLWYPEVPNAGGKGNSNGGSDSLFELQVSGVPTGLPTDFLQTDQDEVRFRGTIRQVPNIAPGGIVIALKVMINDSISAGGAVTIAQTVFTLVNAAREPCALIHFEGILTRIAADKCRCTCRFEMTPSSSISGAFVIGGSSSNWVNLSDSVVDLTFTPTFATDPVYIFPTLNAVTPFSFSLINFSVLGANKI